MPLHQSIQLLTRSHGWASALGDAYDHDTVNQMLLKIHGGPDEPPLCSLDDVTLVQQVALQLCAVEASTRGAFLNCLREDQIKLMGVPHLEFTKLLSLHLTQQQVHVLMQLSQENRLLLMQQKKPTLTQATNRGPELAEAYCIIHQELKRLEKHGSALVLAEFAFENHLFDGYAAREKAAYLQWLVTVTGDRIGQITHLTAEQRGTIRQYRLWQLATNAGAEYTVNLFKFIKQQALCDLDNLPELHDLMRRLTGLVNNDGLTKLGALPAPACTTLINQADGFIAGFSALKPTDMNRIIQYNAWELAQRFGFGPCSMLLSFIETKLPSIADDHSIVHKMVEVLSDLDEEQLRKLDAIPDITTQLQGLRVEEERITGLADEEMSALTKRFRLAEIDQVRSALNASNCNEQMLLELLSLGKTARTHLLSLASDGLNAIALQLQTTLLEPPSAGKSARFSWQLIQPLGLDETLARLEQHKRLQQVHEFRQRISELNKGKLEIGVPYFGTVLSLGGKGAFGLWAPTGTSDMATKINAIELPETYPLESVEHPASIDALITDARQSIAEVASVRLATEANRLLDVQELYDDIRCCWPSIVGAASPKSDHRYDSPSEEEEGKASREPQGGQLRLMAAPSAAPAAKTPTAEIGADQEADSLADDASVTATAGSVG